MKVLNIYKKGKILSLLNITRYLELLLHMISHVLRPLTGGFRNFGLVWFGKETHVRNKGRGWSSRVEIG